MTVKKIMVAFLIASFLILPFLVDIKMTEAQTLVLPTSQDIIYDTSNSQWLPWIRKEDVVPDMISFANTYGGTYESIGKNMMGWDIALFKFGNPNGGRIMIDSYLHGNEYYGHQVLRSVLLWMLTSNDSDAVRIRQNNYILVVPVVNYRWARTNYNVPIWMTTQDPNGSPSDGADGLCGVNLNRNFSPSWSSSLSTSNSDAYSGTAPDSEMESQALINAWNTYQPGIYWNLHQGAGPSTMCTARTTQAQTDANTARNLLPSIQNNLGISNGWSFSVGSGYGSGYSKDGAASRGIAGFLTELDPSWEASSDIKASLDSGEIYKQVKAMFISFCRATEVSNPNPTPTPTPGPTAAPTPTLTPTPSPGPAPSATASISYSGFIQHENSAQETVFVNANSPEATNYLSLGFQLDGRDIASFASSSSLQSLAEEAGFKMVRFFHHRYGWAVSNWNSQTMTGSWNWNNYDRVVNAIRSVGAEPLVCLGYGGSGEITLPSGMPRWNEDSYFPDPDQFAAYAVQWVRHFEGEVKYWEILNEPVQHYFWSDSIKLARYTRFWNIVADAMREEDPTIFISQDGSSVKSVLDYWIENGNHLDFLGFHKYDSSSTRPATDAELFARAESEDIGDIPTTTRKYTLAEARSLYGANTPIICGESNINWMFYPTDTRIQTMTAAVWAGLSIRFWSVQGLNYWLWWDFAGSATTQADQLFGMVNLDNNQPWYSYYVMKMFASNSAVGDTIVQSSATSENIRTHAWINGNNLNILVIHTGTDTTTMNLSGVGGTFSYQKLDTQHSPPQTGNIKTGDTIPLNGYTVMLLQQEIS